MPPSDEEVHPHDFAAELARQIYADLDGVLHDGQNPARDALATATAAALPRAAAIWVLLRAALAALRALRFGLEERFAEPHDADVFDALVAMHPALAEAGDAEVWAEAGQALAAAITASEGGREPLHSALSRAIYRLYDGLRTDDDRLGGRGLMELRTMLLHVDAAAQLPGPPTLTTVLRPDRFRDDFLRYVAAVNAGGADLQEPVATLQSDGRITAIVTRDVHPVEHARQALGEDQLTERLRIEALLDFLQQTRSERPDDTLLGAASDDETAFTALVTAAATTPLAEGQGFAYAPLAQVMRYNLRLLQAAAATATH